MVWLRIAAVAGLVHAAFSIYWGLGGTWLLATVGQSMFHAFDGMLWMLILVGVVKAVCAVVPWLLARSGRLSRRRRGGKSWARNVWLWICWAGAAVLVLWGGAGCVTGQLVLAGVITPEGGYDHAGQIGHAWLWDPLFLVWGITLGIGLIRQSPSGVGPATTRGNR